MEFFTDLNDAIKAAREADEKSTDGAIGLSAQRRNHGGGKYTWAVAFDNDPAAGMIVMEYDLECWTRSNAQIAARIDYMWVEAWDK